MNLDAFYFTIVANLYIFMLIRFLITGFKLFMLWNFL